MIQQERVCSNPDCGESFTPTRRTQKYHDPSCGAAVRNARLVQAPLPERECANECGTVFTPRKVTDLTCGPDCSREYGNEKRRVDGDTLVGGTTDPIAMELRKALRDVEKYKQKTEAMVEAIYTAVSECYSQFKIDAPQPRRFDPKGRDWEDRTEEVALVLVSDIQLGKKTPTYNSDIAEERVKRLAEKVIELSQIQNSHHPVREAHIVFAGDIVEGEGIFKTQTHVIDSSLFRQVGVDGPRILSNFILDLLGWFERLHIVGVIGNHGDVRLANGSANPETNMDRLLYQILYLMLGDQGGRITWSIPQGKDERNWFAVDRIGDWGFLVAHGDQVRGWGGLPYYGMARKAFGWIDAIDEPWDYLLMGHHHTPVSMTLNRRQIRINGSTESDNDFAREVLAANGHPTQWLAFVHPKRGVTGEYWVTLEDRVPSAKRYEDWTSNNG